MPPNAFSYDVGYENIVVTLLLIPVTACLLYTSDAADDYLTV